MKLHSIEICEYLAVAAIAILMAFGRVGAQTVNDGLGHLPLGLPPLTTPADNPLTSAKAKLGEKLFFDPGLSADRTVSCASCHKPAHFFADETPLSKGVGGQSGDRNTVSILNAAYASHLMRDGRSTSLEDQVQYPIAHPREMNNTQNGVIKYLSSNRVYLSMFEKAFGDETVSWNRVTKSIASFERTLLSGNCAFDRYMSGDIRAISRSAKRGFELFRGSAGCIKCHNYSSNSPLLSDFEFHNTGVGWKESPDLGRYQITKAREDKGAFLTPSLRNVAKTAPYMHDGRMASLQDVVNFYSGGGENNPFLDKKIRPLNLTKGEKRDLVAFLESLTGDVTYRPQFLESHKIRTLAQKEHPLEILTDQTGEANIVRNLPKSVSPFGLVQLIAGSSDVGDGGRAIDAIFNGIGGLAVDRKGNVYVADTADNRVRKIDSRNGMVATVAGNGLLSSLDESRIATRQGLSGPGPLAIDRNGHYLFVGEIIERRVKRLDLVSGTMVDLGAPRGGFGEPTGLSWSSMGLLVADAPRGQLWKLNFDGSWTGLLANGVRLRYGIRSLVQEANGKIYIVEYFSNRVLSWDPATSKLDILVATGESSRVAAGEQETQSSLKTPDGIAVDREGNLAVADKGNHRICLIELATGRVKTLTEAGKQGTDERWTPGPIAFDSAGVLWIGDIYSNRLLRYNPGSRFPIVVAGAGSIHDGGPALEARFAHPGAVTSDAKGNVYISDTLHHRVRVIDAKTGQINTVAGTGVPGYNGDGISARKAWLSYPAKLAVDSRGRVLIGDYYNNRVRRVDPVTGLISTVAGNGNAGEEGDDGPADSASLLNPHALEIVGDHSLIVVSAVSPKLRWVDLSRGEIHSLPVRPEVPETVEFYGLASWKGGLVLASPRPGSVEFLKDGKMSVLLERKDIVLPEDVAVSPDGELFICETGRNRVVKWTGSGLKVVLENLGRPRSIGFDSKGNLLIADTFHNRILRLMRKTEQLESRSPPANLPMATEKDSRISGNR